MEEVQAADTKVGRVLRAEPGAFKSMEIDELGRGAGGGEARGRSDRAQAETKAQDCVHRNPNIFGPRRKEEWQAAGPEKKPGEEEWGLRE